MAPLTSTVLALSGLLTAAPQDSPLAEYFGFSDLEIVKVGKAAGPLKIADIDGDGFQDLVVVNNHASRIELHYQRPGATAKGAEISITRPNEVPEHWRFRREQLSVSHRVQSVVAHDFDGDGRMDLIYAGAPGELVFMRQTSGQRFVITRKHRVKKLMANRNGFAVVDVIGDQRPDLLALVAGGIHIWPLDGDVIGHPVKLSAGTDLIAFMPADYNGDERTDIAAVIPDDPAPVRLWLGEREEGAGVLGPQLRFEMADLYELHPVEIAGYAAAAMTVIERASKRLVLYDVAVGGIAQQGDRDAAMEVYSFTDPGNRQRSVSVVDLDGDGMLDLVSTDTQANALVAYRQAKGKGLQPGESYPSYAEVEYLVAGNVDDDPFAELFVLSEKEGVVGRSDAGPQGIPYPSPLAIPDGHTPVALNLVELDGGPRVAVVVKDKRDYAIVLLDMNGGSEKISLGTQSRSPETIIALDADQDGKTDLLLFTRDKPMKMLHAEADGFQLIEDKDMGQFGLVKAATADNTSVFDVDGDGRDELLIADRNYVRAARYEPEPAAGVSPGWQVVEQINADDSASKLVSLTVLRKSIVAADRENARLVLMAAVGGDRSPAPAWQETDSINIKGFTFDSVYAGSFTGDGHDNIMAVGSDGFGVIRLAGESVTLREFASWRTDEERRFQHELTSGDINGDGFTDLVSLDAGEQMCEIFTFDSARGLHYVTGFQVFESKIFSGNERAREYEPSSAVIADVTGDGADDLVLLAHDRVLIYPQMTADAQAHRR